LAFDSQLIILSVIFCSLIKVLILQSFWWIRVSFGYQLYKQLLLFSTQETRENTEYKFLISMSEQVKSQEEFLANFNWHNSKKVLMQLIKKNLLELKN
jgi:small subunit ribosomal protein S1